MTTDEAIQFLARVEGKIEFTRISDGVLMQISAREHRTSEIVLDALATRADYPLAAKIFTSICKKLDNTLGGEPR